MLHDLEISENKDEIFLSRPSPRTPLISSHELLGGLYLKVKNS
jgi:hypothetical protein